MAISLNTNNVSTDTQGRTTFSGVSSGINAQAIVDSVIKAREVRTNKLAAEIKTNDGKVAAFNSLTAKSAAVRGSLQELYGRITADKSANVFDRKALSASTGKRTALANETANTKLSGATDLLNATATNVAAPGSHQIEILKTASAHSVRATFAGDGALGLSGTFRVRAERILDTVSTVGNTVASEIAALVNADPELSKTVTASVTDSHLVLTGRTAGNDFAFNLRAVAADPASLSAEVVTAAGPAAAKVIRYGLASLVTTAPTESETGGNIALDFSALTCVAGEVYAFRLDDAVETSFSVTARPGTDAAAVKANVLADLAAQVNDWCKPGDPATISGSTVLINKSVSGLAAANIVFVPQYRFGLTHSFAATSTDTLGDIRARIAGSNEGATPSGLAASSVSVSATQKLLMVSTARTNRFVTLEMPSTATSAAIPSGDIQYAGRISLRLEGATADQALDVTDLDTGVSAGDTLAQLATKIQTALRQKDRGGGLDSIAVTASGDTLIVSDALGRKPSVLTLNRSNGTSVATLASSTTGIATATSQAPTEATMIVNGTVLRRDENTVSDAIGGITLRLLQAEAQTRVRIAVEQDTAAAQTQIAAFVSAYNDLVRFINEQSQFDPATGALKAESVLGRSSSLRSLRSLLDSIRAATVTYNGGTLALPDIGIKPTATSSSTDLTRGQINIDENTLTGVFLNSPDRVRQLFQFTVTAASANLSAISFSDKTQSSEGTYTLRFTGGTPRVELGGTAYATTRSGNLYTVTAGPAEGLSFLYTGGTADSDSASFTLQPGLASRLYFAADTYAKADAGLLAKEVSQLTDQNKSRQGKIDELKLRFERERESLLARYRRMETTLGRLSSLRETLLQYVESTNAK